MGADSKIEWTDHTFNPWRGCVKVHQGCANCYAESQSKRNPATLGIWGENGTRVVAAEAMWAQPVKWNAEAAAGVRRRVFCASLADVFEDWGGHVRNHTGLPVWINAAGVLDCQVMEGRSDAIFFEAGFKPLRLSDLRLRLFKLIDATPNLDWLLLTKRPENARRMWPAFELGRWDSTGRELQEHADRQVPELLKCRDLAANLFLSVEPLLGPIVLPETVSECPHCGRDPHATGLRKSNAEPFVYYCSHDSCCNQYPLPALDWVIVGGESGGHARPMHPAWVRSLRDQCQAAGVPFFFKQWGEWAPAATEDYHSFAVARGNGSKFGLLQRDGTFGTSGDQAFPMDRRGKKAAGRTLDGREWNEFPAVIEV